MYEGQTYDVILERMLGRVSDKMDKRPSSVIYDTHSPTAIELQVLYIELDTMLKNMYGDTAAREFLILLAKDRGLSPEPATKAVLKGEFVPATIDVIGKRFNINDMNYVVTERIADGQYMVQCETTGARGNKLLGQMIPMEYISGLESATLTEVLIPGEDDEDAEEFRQRYLGSFGDQMFGGNKADYLNKVKSIDGVGSVKVERVWNGDIKPSEMIPGEEVTNWYNSTKDTIPDKVKTWLEGVYRAAKDKKLTVGGTVHVVVTDSDDYGKASNTLISKIQELLDPEEMAGEGYGLAPIGHVVSVESANAVNIDIATTLTFDEGYNMSMVKNEIENSISQYLLELRKNWANTSKTIVRVAQIENHILNVNGVLDIEHTSLNGIEGNITLEKYDIPVLGGVTNE